jgi:CheY-like chemotaxis protein
VELHGGRVAAASPGLGKGSEFVVHLPLAPASAADAPETRRPGVSAPRGALRVLVVDDNQDSADALAEVLRVWGHEVELAYDGVAALDAAARWRPDVVVSDLGLPGMDGYALAQRIRSGPAFGRALLVALSGYGREEDRQRALEAGFDHHLVKPPDLQALAALLGRVAAGPGDRPTRTVH